MPTLQLRTVSIPTSSRGRQKATRAAEQEHNLSTRSEDILVRLAREGNNDALQELMNRARDSCMHIAMGILHNPADAQDEVQNAFFKAYTHIALFTQQSKFSTWVARIVINHCLMRCRLTRRVGLVSYDAVTPDGDTCPSYYPVDGDTPEGEFGTAQVRKIIRRELGRIPALLRVPLELRYLHDLPVDDIARTLGISVPATKSRLHRAQRYLKDRMVRHCGHRGLGTLTRLA